jgi:hypothetical protein
MKSDQDKAEILPQLQKKFFMAVNLTPILSAISLGEDLSGNPSSTIYFRCKNVDGTFF